MYSSREDISVDTQPKAVFVYVKQDKHDEATHQHGLADLVMNPVNFTGIS